MVVFRLSNVALYGNKSGLGHPQSKSTLIVVLDCDTSDVKVVMRAIDVDMSWRGNPMFL